MEALMPFMEAVLLFMAATLPKKSGGAGMGSALWVTALWCAMRGAHFAYGGADVAYGGADVAYGGAD
eukprot:1047352-Rhodomonas_salina.2